MLCKQGRGERECVRIPFAGQKVDLDKTTQFRYHTSYPEDHKRSSRQVKEDKACAGDVLVYRKDFLKACGVPSENLQAALSNHRLFTQALLRGENV